MKSGIALASLAAFALALTLALLLGGSNARKATAPEPAAPRTSVDDRTAPLLADQAAPVERAVLEPGIRGRVLDRETRLALAGVLVRLVHPTPRPTAEAWLERMPAGSTIGIGGDGVVRIDVPGRPRIVVVDGVSRLESPAGTESGARARAASDLSAEMERSLVLAAEGEASAAVEVRLGLAEIVAERTAVMNELMSEPTRSVTVLRAGSIEFAEPREKNESRVTVLGESTTDAAGRFAFACADVDDAWLELVPEPGTVLDPATWSLGAHQVACATPIEWGVRRARCGRIHGRVVDAATSEPVPEIEVHLLGARDARETCVTDAAGRFTTERAFESGTLRAEFRDGPDERRVRARDASREFLADGAGEEAVFAVEIGPTFAFRWSASALNFRGDARLRFHGLVARDAGAAVEDVGAWNEPRGTDRDWFRFEAAVSAVPGARITAEIVAGDGLMRAEVELDHVVGRAGDVPTVALTLAAVVQGTVRDAQGFRVVGATIRALDPTGVEIDRALSDALGGYALRGLDARRAKSIEIVDGAGARRAWSLNLSSGAARELDLAFERP